MSKRSDMWIVLATAALIAVFYCGPWVVSSYFEAKAFNRITGQNVTTWDAMWLNLRVQEPAARD